MSDTKEFFDNLFEHSPIGEFRKIELRSLVFGAGITYQGAKLNEWVDDTSEIENICTDRSGYNHYFACAVRKPNEGGKEGVVECPFLWTEIDFKETPLKKAIENLMDNAFPPTYVIHSGGGFHLYWKLKETFYIQNRKEDIKLWESYLKRLCYAMDGDYNCTDISRILRVPYTNNYKYEHTPLVRIQKYKDVEYDLQELTNHLPPESDIPVKRSKSDINWDAEGFMAKAYQGKPYGEGHRNEVVKEVCKYYANNLPPDSDVYFHVKKFVDECVKEGNYGDINGGVYDERDIKRRVQWAVENRKVNKVLFIEKETDKAVLVMQWLPKDRVEVKGD